MDYVGLVGAIYLHRYKVPGRFVWRYPTKEANSDQYFILAMCHMVIEACVELDYTKLGKGLEMLIGYEPKDPDYAQVLGETVDGAARLLKEMGKRRCIIR
jgi:hypothetical protein